MNLVTGSTKLYSQNNESDQISSSVTEKPT